MATKKYVSFDRLVSYDTLIKQEIVNGDTATLSSSKDYTDSKVSSITSGTIVVKEALHAGSANEATNATNAGSAINDGNGNIIVATYETKSDAIAKLDEAKEYTDTKTTNMATTGVVDNKISTHNTSKTAHNDIRTTLTAVKEDVDTFFKDADLSTSAKDTLKELQTYIASDETATSEMLASLANKTDKGHSHAISDVTNLQTTLDSKQATITGGASTIASSNLTANRALISNGSGKVAISAVTSTELGYLDGVTSAIQTQLDGKAASGHTHTKSQITDFPSTMKNPYSLTIQGNGTTLTNGTYDGSAVKTVNITPSSIGALPSSGGNVSGHIYLTGAKESSSTGNTSQIIFGTSSENHVAISSNNNAIVINPDATSTKNQIVLYLDKASQFPSGISANVTGSLNGTATSANKLNTNAGSTTEPVYFSNGIPVKTTYTLGASVPSDAKFTDTVYTHPSYTARTGKPTANQTPSFGGTATVSQITSDATGHVTGATDRTITIPSTLSNGTGTAGLIKTSSTVKSSSGYTACPVINGVPYYKDTKNTYTLSSFGITATAAELNALDGITATVTELNYCDGVTSNIQTQLNDKAASSHNHSASNITSGTLSSDRLPTVPVTKGGTGATTAAAAATNIIQNQSIKPAAVEFMGASSHGGYIDFHYGGGSEDYTSRIIEAANGVLTIQYANPSSNADSGVIATYGQTWVTPTLKNNFTSVADNPIKYRKFADTCQITGRVARSTAIGSSALSICDLPEGFGASYTKHFFCTTSGANIARVYIRPTSNGKAELVLEWIYSFSGTQQTGTVSWIDLDITYFANS